LAPIRCLRLEHRSSILIGLNMLDASDHGPTNNKQMDRLRRDSAHLQRLLDLDYRNA